MEDVTDTEETVDTRNWSCTVSWDASDGSKAESYFGSWFPGMCLDKATGIAEALIEHDQNIAEFTITLQAVPSCAAAERLKYVEMELRNAKDYIDATTAATEYSTV